MSSLIRKLPIYHYGNAERNTTILGEYNLVALLRCHIAVEPVICILDSDDRVRAMIADIGTAAATAMASSTS